MLYDPATARDLKPWLIKNLEPICDAEPGALAEYILALLKHNASEPELRKELTLQLEEFLEKECSSFVDTLFIALRTKSYLPYSATPSSSSAPNYPSSSTSTDGGIPIPLDGLVHASDSSPERGRKRGIDQDDYDSHGPSKGARLNQDGQFSRYGGREDGRSSWGGRNDRNGARMDMNGARADFMDGGMGGMGMNGGGMGMNGRGGQNYRPPEQRRGICRDYHNNGYCARGAFCKYSHGEDAVIPGQLFPMPGVGGMPFMPMMGPGGMPFPMPGASGGGYDPHERMDMRPTGGAAATGGRPNVRPPVLSRDDGDVPMGQKPGELPVIQDLTPQVPIEDVSPHNTGEGFRPQQRPSTDGMVPPVDMGMIMNGVNSMNSMNGMSSMASMDIPQQFPVPESSAAAPPRSHPVNSRGGGTRGRGRGTFGGDAQSFRPERRNDKTLVVEKIPEDKLTLGAVNDWFSKFGTVTNVAVDAPSAKALVSFSNHEDAHKAWKSEEAVFGNRFVKVFWHRPLEGHGQAGQRMLAASAPMVAQRSTVPAPPSSAAEGSPASRTPTTTATSSSRAPSTSSAAASLAAKQKLLEQQIAEQKTLMGKLSSASPEQKKEIMARLRKLNEEMKPVHPASSSHTPPPVASSSTVPAKRAASTPRTEDHERMERERLDKELEMRGTPDGEEETTEQLQAKLEKLKAEAASLGIPVASEAPHGGSTYRPYRGRGRGARGGFYRGAMRGGPPRASMKLDNRPKKLVVKGASAESLQAVRDWYETTGQVDSVETVDNNDIHVSFRSRSAAEQGFAKGSHIALVGPVQVSWYTGQSSGTLTQGPSASPAPASASSDVHKDIAMDGVSASIEDRDDLHMHEEAEDEAGRWGGDDDGFGML
ncbi:hypothetical protein C8Q80DRAFT_1092235 [Daedaleopsis nitida]|nr:hypothetical protein C8Q80DRAFT_1092235 [Daedaleopsis nitida]